jgi:hypothetical protein
MKLAVIIALAIVGMFAFAQEPEKAKPFFPHDEKGRRGVSASQEQWYSKHLRVMQEESLQSLAKDKNAEVYRFTLLPTWGGPRSVRLSKKEDHFLMVFSRLDGDGGYDPGKLVEHKTASLRQEQVDEFKKLFARVHFFAQPSEDQNRGFDGSEWILEAVAGGQYHVVVRWTPKEYEPEKRGTVDFVKACEWLVAHAPANGEPDGAANGSQPIRSETNRTSSAAGSRR